MIQLQLTDEQRQAIEQHEGQPIDVLDPTTNTRYVLLRASDYERLSALLDDTEFDIRESYQLQEQVARAEGWDDPLMDAYNDYDANRTT